MPALAQDEPRACWQAADAHERANGRLYSEVQFALPRELDSGGRRELAGAADFTAVLATYHRPRWLGPVHT